MHKSLYIKIFFLFSFIILTAGITVTDIIVIKDKTIKGNIMYYYKRGDNGKKILLIGTVHGNEKIGIILSIKILNEIFSKDKLANTLICIPSANPDGNILNTRMNANRVDINRNFPSKNWIYEDSAKIKRDKKGFWGGNQPASEKETKFILKIDSLYNPDVVIVLHQYFDFVNYDGKGKTLAEFISLRTGMRIEDDMGYDTPGSMGSYFGHDKQKEVVTIEMPEFPADSLQRDIVKTLVEVVEKGY